MASFAGREMDPFGAAESGYLAVLAVAVLIPVGFLARWPALELGLGSVLATAAVWALPHGPGRGAVVVLVLAAALAVAAGRRLLRGGTGLEVLIPLALGVQMLMRGDLLFDPSLSLRTPVALIALPVAGALAVWVLSWRHGMALALVAGGSAVVLAPGFNVAATLSLIALAAGELLAREDLGWPVKLGAWVALLAPILWNPAPGVVAAVCGLALWRPEIGLALGIPVAVGLGFIFDQPWSLMWRQVAWFSLLVPAALVSEWEGRWSAWKGWSAVMAGVSAAFLAATVPLVPDLSTMAAPLGLAALSVRRDGSVTVPQRVLTGALLLGTALLASYPWLREEPLEGVLSLLGLSLDLTVATWIAVLFLGLAGLGVWMGRGWGESLRATRLAGLTGACLALALLLSMPDPGRELLVPETPVVIDAGHPSWATGITAGQVVRSVVVESNLSNGIGLAPGTPVAVVRLRDLAGRTVDWTLRAGKDTGEWAARRPDVAQMGTRTPPAWVSWVAGDFFAQRYRSRWTLPAPAQVSRVEIERAPGMPPELVLALYQLEVRR
jgi:hypothetical protein